MSDEPPVAEAPPSERRQLAQRIATFLVDNHLCRVFGGDVTKSGRYYSMAFSLPRTLDGQVLIYGKNFIQVHTRGQHTVADGAVFDSEEKVYAFLKAAFMEFDRDKALAVPQKQRKQVNPS